LRDDQQSASVAFAAVSGLTNRLRDKVPAAEPSREIVKETQSRLPFIFKRSKTSPPVFAEQICSDRLGGRNSFGARFVSRESPDQLKNDRTSRCGGGSEISVSFDMVSW